MDTELAADLLKLFEDCVKRPDTSIATRDLALIYATILKRHGYSEMLFESIDRLTAEAGLKQL